MWDHFREPQLDLKGQEQGGGAAGGQEHLHGEKLLLWFRTSYRLDLGVKPHVLDMANHLGRFLGASGPSEGQEQVGGAVGGEAQVKVVKL